MKLGPFDLPGYAIGDVRELTAQIPDDSVHCVVTSPPYWALRDYGTGAAQIGLEPTVEEYVQVLVEVFRDVRRALRPDGTLWLNLGDTYITSPAGGSRPHKTANLNKDRKREKARDRKKSAAVSGPNRRRNSQLSHKSLVGVPWRVALALQDDGWILRTEVIWHKPNPIPEAVYDRPTRCHEYLFQLVKRPTYYYDPEAIKVRSSPNTHARGRHGIDNSRHGYGVNPKAADVGDPSRAGGRPRPRSNSSMSQAVSRGKVTHRNRRTVWTLQTKPYKGPHHATMPPGLARDPILASTSPRCCAVCGAPWTRQIEVEYINPGNRKTNGPRSLERRGETAGFKTRLERRTKTTGWEPSCDHADGSGRAVVFDPFLGSGTTAMVAAEHDRLWLGFDNNPECAQLIERRTKLVQRSLGLENL